MIDLLIEQLFFIIVVIAAASLLFLWLWLSLSSFSLCKFREPYVAHKGILQDLFCGNLDKLCWQFLASRYQNKFTAV